MFRTNSGSIKYETVISVRLRFNAATESQYDAAMLSNRIAMMIDQYVRNQEDLRVEPGTAQPVITGDIAYEKINVTHIEVNHECTDYAEQSHHRRSVWNLGRYVSPTYLASLWNNKLRHLHDSQVESNDWGRYRFLSTRENPYNNSIDLPALPVTSLRRIVNTADINFDINQAEEAVRTAVLHALEGMYEDDLDPTTTTVHEEPF